AGTMLIPGADLEQFSWLPDLDESGVVDVMDLLEIIAGWGECDALPATCHADLNGDGMIAVEDLLQLLSDWN
ncbi:MAG: hypothetical protein MK095_07925, partial [Phycisphaerales bacterium]|nr:hypothetical protein [Phycisphaerales bacterium]